MGLTNNKELIKPPSDLLFARQPIFDSKKKLYAYELLYRDKDPNFAIFEDGDKATSSLIVNYCGSILNKEEEPNVKIFINLTRKLLLSDYFFPLDPERIVVEILEDMDIDSQLIERIKELRTQGYKFALDDYSFESKFDPLIPLVDYIKVELLHMPIEKLPEKMRQLETKFHTPKKHWPTLLAEKVEEKEMYEQCYKLGFKLFQGYFLEKPMPVYGTKIDNNSETALQIVAKIQESEIDVDDLSHAISRDAKLSYQILKIVNSPLCRLPKKVSSLHEAVVFLGLEQIKKWAMAMALAGNSSQTKELLLLLLTRARACELIALKCAYQDAESYFTVGLFSGIDAVMLADKEWLMNKLDLAEDINMAVLKQSGKRGLVLKNVIALEQQSESLNNLDKESLSNYYSCHEDAISWANQLFHML